MLLNVWEGILPKLHNFEDNGLGVRQQCKVMGCKGQSNFKYVPVSTQSLFMYFALLHSPLNRYERDTLRRRRE